jgi:hypothetical protein
MTRMMKTVRTRAERMEAASATRTMTAMQMASRWMTAMMKTESASGKGTKLVTRTSIMTDEMNVRVRRGFLEQVRRIMMAKSMEW